METFLILVPKNWRDFQHYKDRAPPWIRLQKTLLDNYDFQCLPVASRALAPMLWLVASDSIDGHFDAAVEKLAFRLRQTEQEIQKALKPLIDKGFFEVVQDASNTLADCVQSAVPETETLQRQRHSRDTPPDGVSDSVWDSFKALRKAKRAPITPAAMQGIQGEALRAGWSLEDALKECCARGWQGFKADWVAPQVQKQNMATVTVPGSKEPDPTLAKLDRDAQIPKGIPAELKEQIAKLTGKARA